MKQTGLLFCLTLCFLISCNNQAKPVQNQPTSPPGQSGSAVPAAEKTPDAGKTSESAPVSPVETNQQEIAVFDPSSISQEEKDNTKIEIQQLIQRLNSIIRAKNYNAWVSYLDPNYFAVISSAEYLDRISQSAILVKQKIVLKSAEDYFKHVVVPARTNDRVDEIEFESQNRVKAYTLNNKGERLRLYDLERTGNEWKIIN